MLVKLVMVASAVSASSWRFRGRGARARTFNLRAGPASQVECDESGAFGEWFKRPWGKQWAKGPEVSVNLHWWSRRSALQVGDFEARPSARALTFRSTLDTLSVVRAVHFARASSVPAGRNSGQIGRGVRGFKLVS